MSEYFIGEIRMFGGTFAPLDWAFCNGQTLSISQNDVLYSLIGVTYGGDGVSTFNLPDLQGRVPIHMGTGTGLTTRIIGNKVGTETVTLQTTNLPQHNHTLSASSASTNATAVPANTKVLGTATGNLTLYVSTNTASTVMNSASISASAGGGTSHDNMAPTLCVNFIIALAGIYPTRS
jgi:microcystin-dependent protein